MTSSSRRAMPWLVSLGVHLVLVVTMGILLSAPVREPRAPQVEVSLVGAPGAGRGGPPAGGSALSRGPVPRTRRGQNPPEAASPPVPDPAPTGRVMPVPSSLPMPSARDVLADTAAAAQPVSGTAASSTEAPGSPFGTDVAWEGLPRKLIRRLLPEFPAGLSALGQEVEGEAKISVAPSGLVTRVEITRGSGYIEIDASVEAALRFFLYSRVEGRTETVGTVRFRFRLEKQD